jgi:hypothetical protein
MLEMYVLYTPAYPLAIKKRCIKVQLSLQGKIVDRTSRIFAYNK